MYDRVKNLKHILAKAIYHHSMLSEKQTKKPTKKPADTKQTNTTVIPAYEEKEEEKRNDS